jgi:HPt (histidine-containing phosphotransfer) domain-containing protein
VSVKPVILPAFATILMHVSHPRKTPTTLDEAAVARLRELDPDGRHGVLQRVLSAFENSLLRMLAQLSQDTGSGQAAVLGSVAHTLKSSSASVGALVLAQTCADIERSLRDGQMTELHELREGIDRLVGDGELALVAVRAMLRN